MVVVVMAKREGKRNCGNCGKPGYGVQELVKKVNEYILYQNQNNFD